MVSLCSGAIEAMKVYVYFRGTPKPMNTPRNVPSFVKSHRVKGLGLTPSFLLPGGFPQIPFGDNFSSTHTILVSDPGNESYG